MTKKKSEGFKNDDQRTAAQALKIFKDALDSSTDAIGMSTPDGRHYYQNRSFDELFGDIGENPSDTLFVDAQVGREVFDAIMAGGHWSGEVKMRAKDGGALDIMLRAYANKDESGRVVSLVGVHTDITSLKSARDALRDSEERLRLQIDRMPLASMVWDSGFRVIHWNLSAETMFGQTKAEAIGKPICEIIKLSQTQRLADDIAEAPRHAIDDIFKTDKPLRAERWADNIKGETRLISFALSPILGPDGTVEYVICAMEDITDQKMTENRLKEERERLNHILSITKTGLDIIDAEFNLLFVDKSWQEIYGNPDGRKCYEYFNGRSEPCPTCGIPKAFETKSIIVTEEVMRRENGRVVEVHSIPFKSVTGEWLVAELNVDVTERKAAEAEREKLQAQLLQSQKMESVGQLAGGIAHDFNNIIATISGTTESLISKYPSDSPHFKKLERILKSCGRAKDITMKLLAFARKEKLNAKIQDPAPILSDVVEMLATARSSKIEITLDSRPEDIRINADSNQILQAVLNICLNACDAMPGGGNLSIRLRKERLDYCPDPRLKPGDYAVISVSDTGPGIDDDKVNKVFEPFFTTKDIGKGTGLGLSISHSIIKSHGGFISLDPGKGKGATFHIHIPAADPPQAALSNPDQTPLEKSGGKILVIDDDEDFAEMIRDSLDENGFNANVALSGKEAIELYKKNGSDIQFVLLDMRLPEMNGTEIYFALKEINPDAKIALCSGYSVEGEASALLEQGAVAFIQKPCTLSNLVSVLRSAI